MSTARLLIVDDDPDLREALSELLAAEGYEAVAVRDPEEALAILDEHLFHLVVADAFATPRGDPLEIPARLAQRARPTPLGLVTGWAVAAEAAAGSGIRFVVQKPFDLSELLMQISAALGESLERTSPLASLAVAWFEALNARDWAALAGLCTDSVRYALPGGSPFAASLEGKETLRGHAASMFAAFPDARFGEIASWATPAGMAARYVSTWTDPQGGRVRFAGNVTFQVQDGLIARVGVELNDGRLARLSGKA